MLRRWRDALAAHADQAFPGNGSARDAERLALICENTRLEDEWLRQEHFATHETAVEGLADWIDFYNHRRRHSRLGYRTPAEHEAAYH